MKPAPSFSRLPHHPCGCIGTPPRVTHRCPEAERLWQARRALGEALTTRTPEWRAYQAHFQRRTP